MNAITVNDIVEFPPEILIKILSFLSPYDLCVAERVCKLFQQLSVDFRLWKTHCERECIDIPIQRPENFKEFYLENSLNFLPYRIQTSKDVKVEYLSYSTLINHRFWSVVHLENKIGFIFGKNGPPRLVSDYNPLIRYNLKGDFLFCNNFARMIIGVWNLDTLDEQLRQKTDPLAPNAKNIVGKKFHTSNSSWLLLESDGDVALYDRKTFQICYVLKNEENGEIKHLDRAVFFKHEAVYFRSC